MTKQVSMPMREWNQNENPKFDTNQVHQKEGLGMTTYGPWQTMVCDMCGHMDCHELMNHFVLMYTLSYIHMLLKNVILEQ